MDGIVSVGPVAQSYIGYVPADFDVSAGVFVPTIPPTELPIYLVEISPYDQVDSDTVTKRFATAFYATSPVDSVLPNALFRHCTLNALNYERSLGILNLGRSSIPSYGVVRLAIHDGDLDSLVTDPLAWDDRVIEIRRGASTFSYSDFQLVFRGRMTEMRASFDSISISIQDPATSLRKQAQTQTYDGSGGVNGSSALAGRYKPLCFGFCRNVEPILVDPAALLYQVHSGPIEDADIFVGGSPWTKVTGTPANGQFKVNHADGTITLGGSSPPSLPVTANVKGDATGGYVDQAGALVDRIVRSLVGYTDADIGTLSVGTAQAGIYIQQGGTIEEILNMLCGGLGSWWGFTRDGRFTARLIDGIGSPVATFREHQIMPGMQITAAPPPVWKYRIGYQRTWRRHSETEIATGLSSSEILRLKNEDSAVAVERTAIRTQSPKARELQIAAVMENQADAAAAQARLEAWYGTWRRAWRVQVAGKQHGVDVGDSVRLILPRFGMHNGKDFFVDGVVERDDTDVTDLTLVA